MTLLATTQCLHWCVAEVLHTDIEIDASFKWFIDASFAAYFDFESHTRAVLFL